MITSKGSIIDRRNTHVPIEFYARPLSGGAVLTRIEKREMECVSFSCERFGKEYIYPSFCIFDVAIFSNNGNDKEYRKISLGKIFDLVDWQGKKCYILTAGGEEVMIDLLAKKNIAINWPQSRFDFIDEEFAIRA